MLLEFAESRCPIFRATTPLSRGKLKSKGHGKLSIHFTADYSTIETIFRIIVSANQLCLYGAVANMCEEFETHQDRSEEPDVLMGQSIVLSEIKAEVPLQNENLSYHYVLWQQYQERIKLLSQESKVSKFCMDAGFVQVVEVGQYFMTKDTGYSTKFHTVACREDTLPRDDELSQPIGWIQGNSRIGPVLEVTTSYLWGKNMELKSESGLWVKTILILGSEFLTEQINTWLILITTTQKFLQIYLKNKRHNRVWELLQPDQRQKHNHKRDRNFWITEHFSNEWKKVDWYWTSRILSLSAYEISMKVINLLRHSQTIQREDDGAFQFWKTKNFFQNQCPQILYWSDDRWRIWLAAGGGPKRRYQYCSDISGTILDLRALQGHSGRSLIDLSLQDNVMITTSDVHSIFTLQLRIDTSRSGFKQETNNIPLAYWFQSQGIKILHILTSLYHVERDTCAVHGRNIKTQYFGLILILRFERGWHSVRLDRMQLSFKEHFQLIVSQKLWDWRLEKSYMKDHTCLLDHHQRSHWDAITIGPEGKFNWVLQLINSQKVMLFDSLVEKFNMQRSPN